MDYKIFMYVFVTAEPRFRSRPCEGDGWEHGLATVWAEVTTCLVHALSLIQNNPKVHVLRPSLSLSAPPRPGQALPSVIVRTGTC